MPATPGTRLNVLSTGLHQLDVKCQTLAGQLTAVAPAADVDAAALASDRVVELKSQ